MTDPEQTTYAEECVSIDPATPETLENEFVRVPSDLAYWNEQYAEAFLCWKQAKIAREQLWHALHRELAPNLSPRPGSRGVTVADIEAAVTTDERYLEACTVEIVAEAEKVRLSGTMDALRTKRDMLMSLGAHMRHTIEQGINLRTTEYRDRQELASQS